MSSEELWDRLIARAEEPFIIAEIGVNHENNLATALKMIEEAHQAGAHAVKFQTYKAEKLASRQSPAYWDTAKEPTSSQYELFKKYDRFGQEEFLALARHCSQVGTIFLSTPFDEEAADFLDPLVPFFKISSSDITNRPLVEHIASKGKPILLSTGASEIDEIREAVSWIRQKGQGRICIMHCVLSYPTRYEDANLNMIVHLREVFPQYVIGYSDHTPADEAMLVLTTAFQLGARVIEKHFTLDKTLPGNDHYHAMDPQDLKRLTQNIALARKIGGERAKRVLPCEEKSRTYARRSLVAGRDIPQGTRIEPSMLTQKRPGTGIPPTRLAEVVGRRARVNIPEDTILQWDMLE